MRMDARTTLDSDIRCDIANHHKLTCRRSASTPCRRATTCRRTTHTAARTTIQSAQHIASTCMHNILLFPHSHLHRLCCNTTGRQRLTTTHSKQLDSWQFLGVLVTEACTHPHQHSCKHSCKHVHLELARTERARPYLGGRSWESLRPESLQIQRRPCTAAAAQPAA